jgi:hypothetical protein
MATKKRAEGKSARTPKAPRNGRAPELFDLASIRADLAKIVGRLSVSGRQDTSDLATRLGLREDGAGDGELRTRAAQVLDAVLLTLRPGSRLLRRVSDAERSHGGRERILQSLARAEATLREAVGETSSRVPLPGAAGLRAIFESVELDLQMRLTEEPSVSDSDLALAQQGNPQCRFILVKRTQKPSRVRCVGWQSTTAQRRTCLALHAEA